MLPIIQEDAHLVSRITLLLQIAAHRFDIIVAARELRTAANVIDANQKCPVTPAGFRIDAAKLRIQVHWLAAAKLWDLRVLAVQDRTHALEEPAPGLVPIFIQGLDHGVRAGTTSTTRPGVGREPEVRCIGDVCRRLAVLTAAEHNDGGRHDFAGPGRKGLPVLGEFSRTESFDVASVSLECLLLLVALRRIALFFGSRPVASSLQHVACALPEVKADHLRFRREGIFQDLFLLLHALIGELG
mmetsp:Transcript_63180/g.137384  ORF Transcript_63180/g.137384 Transcript_63180/m.137384 type:complete len:243 (+) Transcript_63180:899-1627(+)